jgi:hypothetical protein
VDRDKKIRKTKARRLDSFGDMTMPDKRGSRGKENIVRISCIRGIIQK